MTRDLAILKCDKISRRGEKVSRNIAMKSVRVKLA